MAAFLEQVKLFLAAANSGEVEVDEKIVEEFGEACKRAFRSNFSKMANQPHTIRASNIGRPLCQQQLEQAGVEREPAAYNFRMKMLFGDLIEAAAISVMRAAKVNVQEVATPVKLDAISGTLDVVIDDKVYDVKSCSDYAFDYKFNKGNEGFQSMRADDAFGYLPQAYLYSEARGRKLGGWIAINKETGEWAVLEPPIADNSYRKEALEKISDNYKALTTKAPFKRCFEPVEETFNGKSTGNKYLPITCSYCPFKKHCWGDITNAPQPKSKAKNPKRYWYLGEIKNG